MSRRDLVFGWIPGDPDHEAAMRFGGEAPGRRAHSQLGLQAMPLYGSPPPRTVVSALRQERGRTPKPYESAPLAAVRRLAAARRRAGPRRWRPCATRR